MKTAAKSLIVMLLVSTPFTAARRADQGNEDASCRSMEQALRDYRELKVGASRQDVAKYFVPDGGMQFPAKTRYVYPSCEYLHVDVEFELIKPAEVAFLPEDKVIGVSKLYVDYPAKD
jgi:mannosyltransferase OCH1-like enzyme